MKRLTFGLGIFIGAATVAGGAIAADCGVVVVAPDNRSASILSGETVSPGDIFSCTATADDGVGQVVVPAGAYGVFRTDTRVFYYLEGDDSFAFQIDSDGQTRLVVVNGDDDFHETAYTHYFGTGLVAADKMFEGDFTFDLTGTDDDGDMPELQFDSVDLLVAYTTMASVEASLEQVGAGETAIVTHLGATAGLLTGSDQPLEGPNEVGVLGGVGSYMFGVKARYNLSDGFSVLAGASLVEQGFDHASVSGPLAAVALRWVEPGFSSFRVFGEGGAELGGFSATFSRHYADGTPEGVTVSGSTTAGLGSVYVRGGIVAEPVVGHEVVLSATVKESFLGVNGYSETLGADNMFPASVGTHTGRFTTVKGTAAWTAALASDVDLTATASVGAVMAHDPVAANIMFVGAASGAPTSSIFAEGGLRLGWQLQPNSSLDAFVQGSVGTNIGTHAQVGAAYRMKF